MTLLLQFLALLAVHWIADFILQTHWQATNKSKRLDALARHVAVYMLVLFFATPLILHSNDPARFGKWLLFVFINGVLHFVTDFFTSRWSSKLYAKQDWHNFFVVIGLDQLIHQTTLALTLLWLA